MAAMMMTTIIPKPANPPATVRACVSPRYGRQRRDRNRVACRIVQQIARQSGIVHIGDDPLANHFLAKFGLDPADIFVAQILMGTLPITIMAVPSRIWTRSERMARMLRVKRNLDQHGRRSYVVPQAALVDDVSGLVAILESGAMASSCPCGQLHDPVGCAALSFSLRATPPEDASSALRL